MVCVVFSPCSGVPDEGWIAETSDNAFLVEFSDDLGVARLVVIVGSFIGY